MPNYQPKGIKRQPKHKEDSEGDKVLLEDSTCASEVIPLPLESGLSKMNTELDCNTRTRSTQMDLTGEDITSMGAAKAKLKNKGELKRNIYR